MLLRRQFCSFGRNAGVLRSLQISGRLFLLCAQGAFGGKPGLLLLGLARLFGCRNPCLLCLDLVELKFGEACVISVWMLGQECAQSVFIVELQRQFVVTANLRLGLATAGVGSTAFGAGTSATSSPPNEP